MTKQEEKDIALRDNIFAQLTIHPAHGYRRIASALGIGKKRVERNMRIFGMRPKIIKNKSLFGRRYSTSGVPNLILGIHPTEADAIWAGDFTRLIFQKRTVYLSVVMDIYTREVIGWEMAYHHRSAFVIDTLDNAAQRRKNLPSIFHSDQGGEYTSEEFISWLSKKRIKPSHSWKGRPWHNGIVESFFHTFKREFGDLSHFANVAKLFEGVAQWINYYNCERVHTSLKMPPQEMGTFTMNFSQGGFRATR